MKLVRATVLTLAVISGLAGLAGLAGTLVLGNAVLDLAAGINELRATAMLEACMTDMECEQYWHQLHPEQEGRDIPPFWQEGARTYDI